MKSIDDIWRKLDLSRSRFELKDLLSELKVYTGEITLNEHRTVVNEIAKVNYEVHWQVPNVISYSINTLLNNNTLDSICDPWASTGLLLHGIIEKFKPSRSHAVALNANDVEIGKIFIPEVKWENSDPLKANALNENEFSAVVSILPFGLKSRETLILNGENNDVEIFGDLDSKILSVYSRLLKNDGIGIFIVTPGFFFRKSAFHIMSDLGLHVDAVFELPAGIFAPNTNITTNLIVVKKGKGEKLFTGKLSNNNKLNKQVISNYLNNKESKNIDFGHIVDSNFFRGLDALRAELEFERLKQTYDGDYYTLNQIAKSITLGKHAESFEFDDVEDAIYIPLIGKSNVVDSLELLTMKSQNYAQLKIDQDKVNAEFVVRFLNSSIGIKIRNMNMSGITIPRLSRDKLNTLGVFVPKLEKQKSILEVGHKILTQKNMLTSLMSELSEYENKLWKDPSQLVNLNSEIDDFAFQTNPGNTVRAEQSLVEWIETLPFPLASILRAWDATSDEDQKLKYEHLLHFFEAFSLFTGLIFLSAFRSNESFFIADKNELVRVLEKNPISHATFGTWKSIVEYLSKKIRNDLTKDEGQQFVAEMFKDPSLNLPRKVSDAGLLEVMTRTNTYRNRWSGHGGVVGNEEAKERNELLIEELSKLRNLMGDLWTETEMLTSVNMTLLDDGFNNEVLLLMGSNSEFKSIKKIMDMPLRKEKLYLHTKGSRQALVLAPLIKMEASPSSAKNACYFYNRISGEHEASFVSYHYVGEPEIVDSLDETIDFINTFNDLGDE